MQVALFMKTTHLIALLLVVSTTIVSAAVAGRLSNRWGVSATAEEAGVQLLKVPKNVGEWQLRKESELNETALNLLQCNAYLYRTYERPGTGDFVVVALLLGPPGPISVHTPEVCYPAREYDVKESRKQIKFAGGKGQTLWSTLFQSKTVDAQLLQVAYAWSDGGEWQAFDDARWPNLGKSHLYKIQIAAMSGDVDRKPDVVCNDFLEDFLPLTSQHLVAATRN